VRHKARKQLNNNLKIKIMEGIFVPLAFFLALFAIFYVYWTTRTKERLALIDKGLDASVFKTDCNKYALVKWGIFLIFAAVGVFTAHLLAQVFNEVAAYFSMILFFGGVGLIVAYFVTNSMAKKA
jgi:hypothetical protein